MGGDLFQDLPPPNAPQIQITSTATQPSSSTPPPPPAPALKSALKRPKPQPTSQPEAVPERRLRFKTTTDASETQVIEAMQKIASHIKNRTKFSKASKLVIQLIQAGSVKPATKDDFFALLEASMLLPTSCNDPLLREDYHALFSAAQDLADCLSEKQRNLLNTWIIRAVWANDLFTDDSFVFSKATGRIKESISNLPIATKADDDMEEAIAIKDETTGIVVTSDEHTNIVVEEESDDPFGLDSLIPKKDEKIIIKRIKEDNEEEKRRFLVLQREALIYCLEIAAKRYKIPWCQTAIDILAKHAFDSISRFTTKQREAIHKLWVSIREQQTRRKQGKSVSGKLDLNAFESLQQKYSTEKISIRRAVGGTGDRKTQQWLG